MSDQSLRGLGAVILTAEQYSLLQIWISSNAAYMDYLDLAAIHSFGQSLTPKVDFPYAPHAYSTNYITNTNGWTEVSGYYKVSNLTDGPYYMVIGTFPPLLNYANFYRLTDCLDNGVPLEPYDQGREGYYYIDDVKMTAFSPRNDCSCDGLSIRTEYQPYSYSCCWRFFPTIPPQLAGDCGVRGVRISSPLIGLDLVASSTAAFGFTLDENEPRKWRAFSGLHLPPGENEFGTFCITNAEIGKSYTIIFEFLDAGENVLCTKTVNVKCGN